MRHGATGIAIINVGEGGENCISLIGGSNLRSTRATLRAPGRPLRRPACCSSSSKCRSPPRSRRRHREGAWRHRHPRSRACPEGGLPPEVLKAVDIITPNETEAGLILGWQPQTPEEGLKAARELRARGVATAIVKLGPAALPSLARP